jgi:hypothetical protein
MKFLKKASLAASIAAVSFAANAELVAMDEMAMAAATGQAGIDLDIQLQGTDAISIGSIVYTDTVEDTNDATEIGGGSLSISNINIGVADNADGSEGTLLLTNAIDITSDGDLQIVGGEVDGLLVSVGSIDLSGGANLVSGLAMEINMGESTTIISEAVEDVVGSGFDADGVNDGATKISHSGSFEIVDGSVNLLDGGIQISGLKVYNADAADNKVTTDVIMWTDANALNIKAGFEGTIELGSVALGSAADAASIGSVAINSLSMTGATIKVSGH